MSNYLLLIIGMMIVTYLPRFLPLIFFKNFKLNDRAELFLSYIPYTSLSILLIRGILTQDKSLQLATVLAIGTSSFLAYIKGNLILSVISGIVVSFIVINIV